MIQDDIEIITVNYNTPDLIEKLLDSWIEFGYNNIPIHVIDGSDRPEFCDSIKQICKRERATLTQFGYNIHHGPGLDFGIKNSQKKYLFLMDSDSYFIKAGLFDELKLPDDCFGIGRLVEIDVYNSQKEPQKLLYLHPNNCLINKEKYLAGSPAVKIKRLPPFINTMLNMKFALKDGREVLIRYVYFGGRGTVSRFGMGK
jgi:glycosyltransferase involved in cell wall biosynthesis